MVAPRGGEVNETARQRGAAPEGGGARGVGGWLLLLCALLLLGQPLSVAIASAHALDSLAMRGTPLALALLARMMVAGVGIAAGMALAGGRRGAPAFATASLALSAAMDLFAYTTRYLPNNRPPGTTPYFIAAALAYYAIWIAYLFRSDRVRNTFPA
jgi:uncharacterized protein DUF2569